jgi:acetolactate synthase-1/2/3 large subunit
MNLERIMKYAEYFIDKLVNLGFTHCFYLSGGNAMHLLEAARTKMECVAVTHEVSAAIAAEYFNVANRNNGRRAFAMVTAGPGLTNLVTGIAGAWLESRELLIVGGQARSNFISRSTVRQIGHQEIDGVSIVGPITKLAVRIEKPISGEDISRIVQVSRNGRKGPVFIEVCLDVSLVEINPDRKSFNSILENIRLEEPTKKVNPENISEVVRLIKESTRPLILIGGGLSFRAFEESYSVLENLGIPICTTWNAADYLDYDSNLYAGRPNTYGMRWANSVIQQCDLLIAIGARLGLQQTGFNWQNFAPEAKVIQIDIDDNELKKNRDLVDIAIKSDAEQFLKGLVSGISDEHFPSWSLWRKFVSQLKNLLPVSEVANRLYPGYVNPFDFLVEISELVTEDDLVIPCSSGGAYTSVMQAFKQKRGNLLTNNKGLASMGYGLAGAIGSAVANPEKKVILFEGDGGFVQNLQEIGTVANRNLNLKMFIYDNGGYASIRISQKSYFSGNYLGCDSQTGIGLPDWMKIFGAWDINAYEITGRLEENKDAFDSFNKTGPSAFILKVHKEQPFLPKITSSVRENGTIESNPIHLMYPPLEDDVANLVFKYLPDNLRI